MQAWSHPEVPPLPGNGFAVRTYDTATGQVRPTGPGPTARLYVCGITPYDSTHLGHAATYIAFDLLNRAWRDAGHDVHYVQNVTDVDDPLLERAAQTEVDWRTLADQHIGRFRDDMTGLRVLPPRDYIGAVESIPLVADLVERLRARGAVYDVEGDLYFSVGTDPRFGSVGNLDAPTMIELFGERGGDPERPGKKDPLDCLLWQQARPGEPAWDSPLGRGRPGWHIECTAISLHHLGMSFDVQGGGSDLIFPHHEMCAAQAQAALGDWPFARAYVHAGMVELDGQKMSKSEGNLVFVSELRAAGHDPMAIRLAILANHYRADWSWTDQALAEAEHRLASWQQAVMADSGPAADQVLEDVRRHLADDLDARAAIGTIDRWVEQTRRGEGDDQRAPRLVAALSDALLGVALRSA